MVVSWVGISLTWDLDQIAPSSTSQTVQLPLPYSEKPQNLDNTPLTQKKYHTMVSAQKNYLLLEVSQPKAAKKSDWRNPYEEGENLPGSIEEDVTAESLCPEYNEKQIRTQKRMKHAPKSFVENTRTSYPCT